MKKKSFLSFALGAVMSLSLCVPVLAACGGQPDHEHEVQNWVTRTAPTCTEEGEEYGLCAVCKQEVTRAIPAKGHVRASIVRQEKGVTCTEDGLLIIHCAVCDKDVEEVIPAPGHDWVHEGIFPQQPTCTAGGEELAHCDRCGTSETIEVPALGHSYDDFFTIVKPASFEETGLRRRNCSRCDAFTDEQEIPVLDRNTPVNYQLRAVRTNGDAIKTAGFSFEVLDEEGTPVVARSSLVNGTQNLPLLPAQYTVHFLEVPDGYTAAQESFSISWEDLDVELVFTASLRTGTPDANVKYGLGSVMYDFTVQTVATSANTAETLTLSGLLQSHSAVVLNFWDTSCSFCRYEFPGLEAAYKEFKEDIAVLAIDDPDGMGSEETADEVRRYFNSNNLTFPVTMDPAGGLADMFGVKNLGYPVTVVIDKEGVVSYLHNGALVDPQDYGNVAYSTAQFKALFTRFSSNA